MTKYIITLSDDKAVSPFLEFIKNVNFIKEVVELPDDKPLTDEDWIKPGRPATDEEFEEMIASAENSKDLSLDEAKKITSLSTNHLR